MKDGQNFIGGEALGKGIRCLHSGAKAVCGGVLGRGCHDPDFALGRSNLAVGMWNMLVHGKR